MKKNKFYRGRFLIGIYALEHEGETCLSICDNIDEFAQYLKTNRNNASVIIQKLWSGKCNYIKSEGKLRTVSFIDMLEEDL